MRRLFIMRKDLNMSAGKLAAQVAHCAEAYWTNGIRNAAKSYDDNYYMFDGLIYKEVYEDYIAGRFTKTICEARNKNHLLKAVEVAQELGLIENVHYGLIYDACLTELVPEEENGTTLTGIWFCPLKDDVAHYISKKYQLYH